MKVGGLLLFIVLILQVNNGQSVLARIYVRKGHMYCSDSITISLKYDNLSLAKEECDKGDCTGVLDVGCKNKEFQLCPIGSVIKTSNIGSCIHTIAHGLDDWFLHGKEEYKTIQNAWIKVKTPAYCTEIDEDFTGKWEPYRRGYLNKDYELVMDSGCQGTEYIPCRANTTIKKSNIGSCVWARPDSFLYNCPVTITDEGPEFESTEEGEDANWEFFDKDEIPGCFHDCDCSCAAPFCSYTTKDEWFVDDPDWGPRPRDEFLGAFNKPGFCHGNPQGPRQIVEDPEWDTNPTPPDQPFRCRRKFDRGEELAQACYDKSEGTPCTSDNDCVDSRKPGSIHCGFKTCGLPAPLRCYATQGNDRTCSWRPPWGAVCGATFRPPHGSFGTGSTSATGAPKKVTGRRCPKGFHWKRTNSGIRCAKKKRT